MTSIHKTEPKGGVSRIASSTLVALCDLGTCRRITVHGGWVTKSGPCWWWGAVRSGAMGGGTNTCLQHLPPEPEPQPPARQRARQADRQAYRGVRSSAVVPTHSYTYWRQCSSRAPKLASTSLYWFCSEEWDTWMIGFTRVQVRSSCNLSD